MTATHTVPYYLYLHELRGHLVAIGLYDQQWFEAVAWHLSVLRDIINDARSLTAIEAEEVARGQS